MLTRLFFIILRPTGFPVGLLLFPQKSIYKIRIFVYNEKVQFAQET